MSALYDFFARVVKTLRLHEILPLSPGRLHALARLVGLATLIGMGAGAAAVAFQIAARIVVRYGLEFVAGYRVTGPVNEGDFFSHFAGITGGYSPWLLLVVITLGGFASSFIVNRFAPEAKGHGTDAAIRAYHQDNGKIRSRVPFVKLASAALTLGTGGSGGREGPIAQIGAGWGSFLATKLRLSDYERRLLLTSGMGAGIAAIFRAPLAGAIFAIEVLYRDEDLEAEALIPSFVSCTVAYCTFGLIMQWAFGITSAFGPIFSVMPGLSFQDVRLLGPLAIMAVAMAIASFLYVKCYYGMDKLFNHLRISKYYKAPIGALLAGVLALVIYYSVSGLGSEVQNDTMNVLSFGYGFLQKALGGHFQYAPHVAIAVFLLVGLGKIVTTSLTLGSGGSGGVFGPSMVIGGSLGGAVGVLCQMWWPGVVTRVDVFVILGMAAFFSAAAKTPLSTIVIASEMTAGYALLLPAMWVAAIAYVISRGWSIYKDQVPSRMESPAHRSDFVIDVLKGLKVANVQKAETAPIVTFTQDTGYAEICQKVPGTSQVIFPVVDAEGLLLGVFSFNEIRQYLFKQEVAGAVIAYDLTVKLPEPLCPDTDLSTAMAIFARTSYDELPVVQSPAFPKVMYIIRRHDIVKMYDAQMSKLKFKK